MRIGIYGGTFSPIHNGHVAAAKAFMEQMWLDVLYIIPTGITPHKEMHGDATAEDRLEMCRLAFNGMDGIIISDMEMKRTGKSYTVDTLRDFRQRMSPEDRLFFLMGTDMMLSLDSWKEPAEIFRLCYPVYIRREADKSLDDKLIAAVAHYNAVYGKVVRKVAVPPLVVSSTEIREKIAKGISVDDMLPEAVYTYIRNKGLYQTTAKEETAHAEQ